MDTSSLTEHIRTKGSFLCVGIDPVLERLPSHLRTDSKGLLTFCTAIVDATADHCVAFKPNTAFFEAFGVDGWSALSELVAYIKKHHPSHLIIADAKRGDIGNTAKAYAKAFFEAMNCDAITLSPYMGAETLTPYLEYPNKFAIVLALTSNQGAFDFQWNAEEGKETHLVERVIAKTQTLPNSERIMYVVGATQNTQLAYLRTLAPNSFFLMPGIGAQGGSLSEAYAAAKNASVGVLVNSSRGIIYASSGPDFAEAAQKEAAVLHEQMRALLYI